MYSEDHTPTNQVYNIERNMIIKRILSIILAIILIILSTSCTSPTVDEPPVEQDFSNTVVTVSDLGANEQGFTVNTDGVCSIRAPGGTLNYRELAKSANIPLEVKGLTTENRAMKILAQDSDVDIYLMSHTDVKLILDNGAYEPIESDIISDYVSKTFEPLQELCIDSSGNVIMMPIEYSISGLYIPKKAVEELNIKAEDIEYLDDYLEFLRSYTGDRECYGTTDGLFYEMECQYNYYFCDFENGVFDYDTELYRGLYEELLGNWVDDGTGRKTPWFYRPIKYDTKSVDKNLFKLTTMGSYIDYFKLADVYSQGTAESFFEDFVSFPIPKLNEQVETSNVASACFAYINPYSENKEAAVKLLETIAEDYFGFASENASQIIFSDPEMYPDWYDTDSQVFKEYVEMSNDSVMFFYDRLEERFDVWDYSAGEITLDEAIAERSRVVNIMLNE